MVKTKWMNNKYKVFNNNKQVIIEIIAFEISVLICFFFNNSSLSIVYFILCRVLAKVYNWYKWPSTCASVGGVMQLSPGSSLHTQYYTFAFYPSMSCCAFNSINLRKIIFNKKYKHKFVHDLGK